MGVHREFRVPARASADRTKGSARTDGELENFRPQPVETTLGLTAGAPVANLNRCIRRVGIVPGPSWKPERISSFGRNLKP